MTVASFEVGRAAALCGQLWREVLMNGGLQPDVPMHRYAPGVISLKLVDELFGLFESGRSDEQVVSLVHAVDGVSQFDPQTGSAVEEAYRQRPRTQVFENLHEGGGWPLLVTAKLMELAGCRVVCKAFKSHPSDEKFDEHCDHWCGLLVQLNGRKEWRLRATQNDQPVTVVTSPGDVLILPEGIYHAVNTPSQEDSPRGGYSLHVQFAVVTRSPL